MATCSAKIISRPEFSKSTRASTADVSIGQSRSFEINRIPRVCLGASSKQPPVPEPSQSLVQCASMYVLFGGPAAWRIWNTLRSFTSTPLSFSFATSVEFFGGLLVFVGRCTYWHHSGCPRFGNWIEFPSSSVSSTSGIKVDQWIRSVVRYRIAHLTINNRIYRPASPAGRKKKIDSPKSFVVMIFSSTEQVGRILCTMNGDVR